MVGSYTVTYLQAALIMKERDEPRDTVVFIKGDFTRPGDPVTPGTPRVLPAIRILDEIGFKVMATGGTQRFLIENGIQSTKINKVLEGRPHIEDAIRNHRQYIFTDRQFLPQFEMRVRNIVDHFPKE